MTFFQRLLRETQSERDAFLAIPQLQQGAAGRIQHASYIAFLTQAYHHVKHTVPLLMLCGGRLPERLEWLRVAVGEYISEEMGHQEWILDDLRACGVDAEAIRHGRPAPETELMVAYAYDTVQRGNPVGFFGMVLVLEGTSVRLATDAAAAIQANLRLPIQAFRYLTSHGALDVGHMGFYESLVNRLDQSQDQQSVVDTARMMYWLYGGIFRSLPLEPSPCPLTEEEEMT